MRTGELFRLAKRVFAGRSCVATIQRVPASQGDDTFNGCIVAAKSLRSSFDMNAVRGNVRVMIEVTADFEDEVREELERILKALEKGSKL